MIHLPKVLVLAVLAAVPITATCRSDGPPLPRGEGSTSSTVPEISTPEVIEWFLGEQVRGSKPSNRKTHLGIITFDVSNDTDPSAKSIVHPNSCVEGLVSFIPTPTRDGVWFGIDERGKLLRYAGAGWAVMPATVTIPPIGKLLAFSNRWKRLNLLVAVLKDNREYLSVLIIANGQVVDLKSPDPLGFGDRHAALQEFDSGRCVGGVRDCLHLTRVDDDLVIMREPELYAVRSEVATLEAGRTRDVRYANIEGTKVDVLTTDACPSAGERRSDTEAPP